MKTRLIERYLMTIRTRRMPKIYTERQTAVNEFKPVKFVFIPIPKHTSRQGLSERVIRKHLEKQGWIVWRGGAVDILSLPEVYPNVRRKYKKLHDLLNIHLPNTLDYLQYLCAVHHGIPDFICFRNGEFKFVECKLGHEQLSKRQKRCIPKLQKLGFKVEVHKLAEPCTKIRIATVNLQTGHKRIYEKQLKLKTKHY